MSRYRNEANENERIDRKFCDSYEDVLAWITYTKAQCAEVGCVLKVFTKKHDFKETTKAQIRGSVKGT